MEDLTGKRFGRLVVLNLLKGHKALWHCKCDCGNEVDVTTSLLLMGHNKSCGCLNDEKRHNLPNYKKSHGQSETRLYRIWSGMKMRCNNPNYKHYDRYGGRGIKVCDEWKSSFENFSKWAYENGYDESQDGRKQSIDRIDTDGDYEPSNCRWASQTEQVRNRSISVSSNYEGEEINPYQFKEIYNDIDKVFVYRRLKKGQSYEKILYDWNMLHSPTDDYWTVNEAAEHFFVTSQTIKNRIKRGQIKAERIGCRLFIKKDQFGRND